MSDTELEQIQTKLNELFSDLRVTTISLNGELSHIQPNEINDMPKLKCTGNIIRIKSNYGTITADEYKHLFADAKVKKSRNKPSDIAVSVMASKSKRTTDTVTKSKRARNMVGESECESSQATYYILSMAPGKKVPMYQIKVFRKGKIQIPGVESTNYKYICSALNELLVYLREFYGQPQARVVSLVTTMTNYVCRLVYQNKFISLRKLKREIELYKATNPYQDKVNSYIHNSLVKLFGAAAVSSQVEKEVADDKDDSVEFWNEDTKQVKHKTAEKYDPPKKELTIIRIGDKSIVEMKKYNISDYPTIVAILAGSTRERIAEISYDSVKSPSTLRMKVYQSHVGRFKTDNTKKPKKTSVNVRIKGRIAFEGGNDYAEILSIYNWFMKFIVEKKDIVLVNLSNLYQAEEESSEDEALFSNFVPPNLKNSKSARKRSGPKSACVAADDDDSS